MEEPAAVVLERIVRGARRRARRVPVLLALLAVVVLAAPACGDAGSGDTTDAGEATIDPWGRTFLSTAVTDAGQDRPLVEGTRVRLDFRDHGTNPGDDGTSLGASAGCNSMAGAARVEEDRLIVEDLATTEMGCDPARQEQDEWLAAFLTTEPIIRLSADVMTLTSEDGEIRFLDQEAAEPDRLLAGTRWVVDTILEADSASSVPQRPSAELTIGPDGRFSGSTGCNSMSGTITYGPDDTITFADVVTTKKACPGEAAPLEQAVLAVLDGDVAFVIDADVLRLDHPGGLGLGLRASP